MAVAGEREMKSDSLSVRLRNGESISLKKNTFIEKILNIVEKREPDINF